MKLESIEFRSPIAYVEFSNGRKLPLIFDQVWQRRLSAIWEALGGLVDDAESGEAAGTAGTIDRGAQIVQAAELAQTLAVPRGQAKAMEASADALSALLAPQRAPFDAKEAILAAGPQRQDFSTFKFLTDIAANQANYPASAYPNSLYLATDTYDWYHPANGAGWTQIIYPAILFLLSAAATHGALARSGAGLEARLGDNSAATFMKVLDEVYGAPWDGSTEVPTKNAVYDKIEAVIAAAVALVSDAVYGAGWNGVTTIAPSKNAVYDKVETLLSKNGVNFGPAAVASVTIVDGQVTAIS